MQLTWLESNTWLWELGCTRILVDPWFVGALTFGNTPWLFQAERSRPCALPTDVDVILLSQGLPDHCHEPTLRACDRALPVIASPSAAKVAQSLGFETVIALRPHQTHTYRDLTIQATKGASIGSRQQENGYILRCGSQTLYYEPHGCHDSWLRTYGKVDVVITPLLDVCLPVVGAILKGGKTALELGQWLQPKVMITTAGNGSLRLQGWLPRLLSVKGTLEELQAQFQRRNLDTRLVEPVAYTPLLLLAEV
ncbi:MBL fold metallo-hydrolase [Thermosynechococcus sichuanensis E542]|uniref:MBL fold metallo-hydrolase n=1 Tax=Thermosynechococcus sichuanensis E542 TaxID=2016101 RepID=A0A3B7MHS7_9CYAN|nr:MBL fold metallo-hydrolase [Thermosynechococcus vestitus]AXY67410.1 MBL fold metallo-hydrolase [Thermosynechococcus vestitus E542]